ncbi:Competence damage-inducible protein [Neofusicoccum parvum]|uniref:Competence damage-inducible protein n=2 Tax=Neofusicoccum parvum TaxID=310453 RepID=A0ACB5RUK1_9PEZI|nr:putative competence damage-inducible protein [Neofusicoccum parvum UCRNP2]GME24179.1 Competence damage-inducible protein [Neofusicoccum parvum]GME49763.1 Competence damage-inducible protein [Neofusicoccum parvum]
MPSKTVDAVFPPAELREIVTEVVELLKDRGETISCGETEQIDNFTGPSIHCVLGLAEHVRGQLGSTYAVAESGTAGPTHWGKTSNMQAGYVALAVASGSGCVEREIETGLTDRDANMVKFAVEALRLVKDVIAADMARFSGWLNC